MATHPAEQVRPGASSNRRAGIAVACGIGSAVGPAAFSAPTFPFFLKAITDEFQWPVATVTGAFGLSVLSVPIILPLSGHLVDRYGARAVALPAMLLYGIATLLFAFLQKSPTQLTFLFLLSGLGGLTAAMTPLLKVVSAAFPEKRGLALALLIGGSAAASGALAAPGVQYIISEWGWRSAYMVLAGIILLIALPLQYFLLRPGAWEENPSPAKSAPQAETGLTLKASLLTRAFWLALYALVVNAFALMAFRQHIVFIFGERGIAATFAAYATSMILLSSVIGQFAAGYMADRWSNPRVLLPFFIFPTVGLWLTLYAGTGPAFLLIAALLLGLGSGGENCLSPYLTSRYFGLRAFGRIQGVKLAVITVATGFAGGVAGVLHDRGYTYAAMGATMSILLVIGMAAIALLPHYPRVVQTPSREALRS